MGVSSSKKQTTPNVPRLEGNVHLQLSKQILDFNLKDEACPLNQPIWDEIEVKKPWFKKDTIQI